MSSPSSPLRERATVRDLPPGTARPEPALDPDYLPLRATLALGVLQLVLGAASCVLPLTTELETRTSWGLFAVGGLLLLLGLATILTAPKRFHLIQDVSLMLTAVILVAFNLLYPDVRTLLTFGIMMLLLSTAAATMLPPRRVFIHVTVYVFGLAVATWPTAEVLPGIYAVFCIVAMVAVTALVTTLVRDHRILLDQLREMAVRDPLTGAYNRRGGEMQATMAHAVADRSGHPTSVAAIDLDGFKLYNDTHGHPAGDALLQGLVATWASRLRASDVIIRMGGDEFLLVMPHAGKNAVGNVLEELRDLHPARWTFACTEWGRQESFEQVVRRIDTYLYERKGDLPSRALTVDLIPTAPAPVEAIAEVPEAPEVFDDAGPAAAPTLIRPANASPVSQVVNFDHSQQEAPRTAAEERRSPTPIAPSSTPPPAPVPDVLRLDGQ